MVDLPERALIGALLHLPIEDTREIRGQFLRDDLDDARLRIVVDLIDNCLSRNVRPDPVTVFTAGFSSGKVPAAGLNALGKLLQEIHGEVPHPLWAGMYAAAVVELSVRRRLIATSVRLSQAADSESLESVTDVARTEAEAVLAAVARLDKRVTV